MKKTVLRVEEGTKKIKRHEIIKGMSFTVEKGEICGFIGPNGAEKITMRLLTSLIKPTKGQIFINGVNVIKNREETLKSLGAIDEAPIFFFSYER